MHGRMLAVVGPGYTIFSCGGKRIECQTPGCTNTASTACRYPVKAGKCGLHLCARCAVHVADGIDLCQPHAKLRAKRAAGHGER